MKYLVVDGYALAYRAYHAYPPLSNGKRETKVTVGFFQQILSRAGEEFNERQLIFVFDSKGGSFRKELDAEYKANRSSAESSFYDQVEEIVMLCEKIAPTYRITGYEADDLAGSFVAQHVTDEDDAILLTVDGDWLQLLRKNVTVKQLKTTGRPTIWTRDSFYESYSGLKPEQLIDLKALQGDGSDNIPGLKGVGWVTAHKLLKEYKTIEGIYENILKIPNKGGIQVTLMQEKERVQLNKRLATIKTDIELDSPADYKTDIMPFLTYLNDELKADSLANTMSVYLQTKEAEAEGEQAS